MLLASFDLHEHHISHFLLLNCFGRQSLLLLSLLFEVSTSLIKQLLIEIIALFLVLFAELSPKFDLLVKYLPYLFQLLLLLCLLLLELLLVKIVAKLLNLAPLIFADV